LNIDARLENEPEEAPLLAVNAGIEGFIECIDAR
jgi:hypothetical protein